MSCMLLEETRHSVNATKNGSVSVMVWPADPDAPSVRVTVRASLGWKRPYVQKGQQFQVVGVVGQFASAAPWNGGYRVLVRYESDLIRLSSPK